MLGQAPAHPSNVSPSCPPTTLLVEISILEKAGGVTSAMALVVPVADELLPRAAVALGDGCVVELLWWDAFQWLGIACRWSKAHGGAGRRRVGGAAGFFSPSAPTPAHPTDTVGGGKPGAGMGEG